MNLRKMLAVPFFGLLSFLLFSALRSPHTAPKDLMGAWGYGPAENRTEMLMTDKVFSVANYDGPGKRFISSYGGTWRMEGNKLLKKIEWNSADSLQVGSEVAEDIRLANGKLSVRQTGATWNRLDDGKSDDLSGAWIITGNFRNDTAAKRANPFYPRRTMKILSGQHFHWIAYNVATKAFMNAGGGTYTASNGQYTETVSFFTKTSESVGKTLPFEYTFVKGDWRHKGQKSTGGDLDECWSRRETLEK